MLSEILPAGANDPARPLSSAVGCRLSAARLLSDQGKRNVSERLR